MNFKLTVALTVLLLVALVLFLIPRGSDSTSTTNPSSASDLLSPKPSDLVQITFINRNGDEANFAKESEQWKIVSGASKVDADNSQLDSIARSLAGLTFVQKFAPEEKGQKSAEYTGTAKPSYTIKFSDKDKHNYTLQIGKRNAQGGVFATIGGDKNIYVLDSNPALQLDKDPSKLRNMQVTQIDTTKVTAITLKTRDAAWEVTKSPENKWVVNKPVAARANDGVVQAILKELQSLRAESFSAYLTKKDTGLEPAITTISVTTQDSPTPLPPTASAPASAPAAPTKTTVIEIGIRTDLNADKLNSPVYASVAGSDSVFVLKGDTAKALVKELKDMRDAAVTPVAVNTATEFTLTTDGKVTVSAALKDKEWRLTAPVELKADPLGIADFLDDVKGLHAAKFVDAGDPKTIGLDPPHIKIELTLPGQSQKEVILLGKAEQDPEKGKVTPVMRQGESTVFLLQASETEKLEAGLLTLRDKEVERLDANRIRTIAISGPQATEGAVPATAPASRPATAPAATPGITLKREGTLWSAEKEGASMPANESKVSALLGSFTPVLAGKYTDEKPIDGTPNITVTLTVLESTAMPATAPSTTPAGSAATTTAPATAAATAPATQPNLAALLPNSIGPDAGKLVTRTLKLYKVDASATAPATAPGATTQPAGPTWKAVWDHQTPTWTFEPTNLLIDQLTKETYATIPATRPATQPAPGP